jgi:hypothetical protein
MAPPKCGSTAIKQFIWMNEVDNKVTLLQQYQVGGKIFVVVRRPLDRFGSLWRNKCRDQEDIRDTRVYGMSPEELMTHIESGARNIHWTPQTAMISNLDVTLIPLDLFSTWWGRRGYGELGKFHATDGEVDMDDSLKDRVLTFYADDVMLYDKAEREFSWEIALN